MSRPLAQAERFERVELFGFTLSRTGLTPSGKKKPSELQWQQLGDYLAWMEGAIHWLIGDWMIWGEGQYGERASQAMDASGWDLDTVKQVEWVCRQVSPDRRDPALKFSHHRAVASLKPAKQTELLTLARDRRMNVRQLMREVAAVEAVEPDADATLWLIVSCRSERDRQRLAEQMEAEGRTVRS